MDPPAIRRRPLLQPARVTGVWDCNAPVKSLVCEAPHPAYSITHVSPFPSSIACTARAREAMSQCGSAGDCDASHARCSSYPRCCHLSRIINCDRDVCEEKARQDESAASSFSCLFCLSRLCLQQHDGFSQVQRTGDGDFPRKLRLCALRDSKKISASNDRTRAKSRDESL